MTYSIFDWKRTEMWPGSKRITRPTCRTTKILNTDVNATITISSILSAIETAMKLPIPVQGLVQIMESEEQPWAEQILKRTTSKPSEIDDNLPSAICSACTFPATQFAQTTRRDPKICVSTGEIDWILTRKKQLNSTQRLARQASATTSREHVTSISVRRFLAW